MSKDYGNWEVVIGLEIHAELNTKSKMFSSAPNRFGDEPNTNISVICTGQPGSLPVVNKEAVKKAALFGLAVEGKVAPFCKFDRKSYFYPDSPRNFQITQYDEPIVLGGKVIAEVDGEEHLFEIDHAHLEDDAGMLKHFSNFAGVDYNRAGVPLVEIVSKPCIHSPQQAVAYAMAVRAILQYIDASDCNMEEGSLRFDANISVRKKGERELRNKIEIKNMNSFSNMQMALESEIHRQIALYEEHPNKAPNDVIEQATYRWDLDTRSTILMRRKEEAEDYRYFPEPDLPPIKLGAEYVEQLRASLPELPLQRERRYVRDYGIATHAAFLLTSDKKLADYFDAAVKNCPNAKSVSNWILVEIAGRLKEKAVLIYDSTISPCDIADLVNMIDKGTITGKIAKSVADDLVSMPGKSVEEIVKANPDYQPLQDFDAIEKIVDQVLEKNPQSIADFKAGKDRAFGFLVGQVMQLTKGKASPQIANELLKKKLSDL